MLGPTRDRLALARVKRLVELLDADFDEDKGHPGEKPCNVIRLSLSGPFSWS